MLPSSWSGILRGIWSFGIEVFLLWGFLLLILLLILGI